MNDDMRQVALSLRRGGSYSPQELVDMLEEAAGELERCKRIIQAHAKARISGMLSETGSPQVPCPICGGEAVGHLDAMRRAYFIPESLVTQGRSCHPQFPEGYPAPPYSDFNDIAAIDAILSDIPKKEYPK